jgi:hypothetical protein
VEGRYASMGPMDLSRGDGYIDCADFNCYGAGLTAGKAPYTDCHCARLGMRQAVVQAPGGERRHAISSHLKCYSTAGDEAARREKSQECINNYMDALGGTAPIISSGDLNSFSPSGVGACTGGKPSSRSCL